MTQLATLIEIHERVSRIETKLDMVLEQVVPEVKKNTKFRHCATAIGSFVIGLVSLLSGYICFWK